jgi:hypothetical protein
MVLKTAIKNSFTGNQTPAMQSGAVLIALAMARLYSVFEKLLHTGYA